MHKYFSWFGLPGSMVLSGLLSLTALVLALCFHSKDRWLCCAAMLLSTIGRARNTGAQFDGEKMIDIGHAPIVSEVIEADISIRTKYDDLTVWAVNSDGYYVGKLPTTYADGWMKFHTGNHYPAQYYLIVKE